MAERYTEGRLRRFLLLHHRERMPALPGLPGRVWTPVGVGIHVRRHGAEPGGSLDALLLSDRAEFLLVEIKRRDNTERAGAPIRQAERYWRGLARYPSFAAVRDQLEAKWESKETWRWVRVRGRATSKRFGKAIAQLGVPDGRLARAFNAMDPARPRLLVVQNDRLHPRTRAAIEQARAAGRDVWGLEVSFPREQDRAWEVR